MRRGVLVTFVLAALAAGGPVLAEQVIHFTNGTAMPIVSHTVQGNMIHVDLGGNAFIAFPFDQVEKVVEAGEEVQLTPSFASGNKIIVDTTPDPSRVAPVRGKRPAGAQAAELRQQRAKAAARQNLGGMRAGGGRFATEAHSRKQQLGGALRPSSDGGNERYLQGTTRFGNRNVIGGVTPPRGRGGEPKPVISPMQPANQGGDQGEPPETDDAAAGGSAQDSDSTGSQS